MPAIPSPAATLVLLRDRPSGGVETLLIQRHEASRFAAGNFVFPGGKIEIGDMPANAGTLCAGLTPAEAIRRLGNVASNDAALGFWVGAIRETFEEVGILLAYTADGRLLGLSGETGRRFEARRRDCQQDERAFWTMLREERLTLATDRLVYFAHWITPEESKIRFDTRFFAAGAPPEQDPTVDGKEIIDCRWMTPEDAIAAGRRGEMGFRPPTVQNLTLLTGTSDMAGVLAALGGRAVQTIRPRIIPDGDDVRVLFPGDPGWY
jgi:8-oxo-dGTP pyrophosphatase MutT (NUDIX family)